MRLLFKWIHSGIFSIDQTVAEGRGVEIARIFYCVFLVGWLSFGPFPDDFFGPLL